MYNKNNGRAMFSFILFSFLYFSAPVTADSTATAQFEMAKTDFEIVNRGGTGNSAKGKLKRFIKKHPDSQYADDAYILLSSFFLQRKSEKSAKQWLEKLAISVPNSTLIALSETYLSRLKNIKSEFKEHNVNWYEQQKVLRNLGRELASDYEKAIATKPIEQKPASTQALNNKSHIVPRSPQENDKPRRIVPRYFSIVVGQGLDKAAIGKKLDEAAGMSKKFVIGIDYRKLSADNMDAIRFILEKNVLSKVKQAGDAINSELKSVKPNYADEYESVILNAELSITKINQVLDYWPNIDLGKEAGATAFEKELSDILEPVRASVKKQLLGGVKSFESKYRHIKNNKRQVANLDSEACKKTRTAVPVASPEDYSSAKKMYANERRHGAPYRSVEDIADLLAKVKHIHALSKACNIPAGDISLSRYFELTGRQF